MGGDDAERVSLDEFFEDGLCQRTADERLCAGTHLIDEDKRAVVSLFKERAHVTQVRGIGG